MLKSLNVQRRKFVRYKGAIVGRKAVNRDRNKLNRHFTPYALRFTKDLDFGFYPMPH